jgi:hypothetical protein
MLSPFLVLGLGGSGGKTLQILHDGLLLQLRRAGWQADTLPAAWQLLHIDVPPQSDCGQADLPPVMHGDSYVGLAAQSVSYHDLHSALKERIDNNLEAREAAASWLPDPVHVTVTIERGAGQFRAVGRALTVFHMKRIADSIQRSIRAMTGVNSEAELKQIATGLGMDSAVGVGRPTAVVVASVAGGSGAGMFMDVCDVLRLTGAPWCSDSVALLYTPDVFDELDTQQRLGVRPNALASLSEILAGFWDQDGLGREEQALFQTFSGLSSGPGQTRVGPRYPFLVGKSNGHVDFKTQNAAYRSTGRALSAWITTPQLHNKMSSQVIGNWPNSQGSTSVLPFRDANQEQPFNAIGFARLSLGRDRFAEYAQERLARSAMDRLLRGHMENRPFGEARSADVVQVEVENAQWPGFLKESGLDRDPEDWADGVADAFIKVVADWQARIVGIAFDRSPDATLAASDLALRCATDLAANDQVIMGAFRQAYIDYAREWVRDTQANLVTFALRASATLGLPVTIGLLDRLRAEVLADIAPSAEKASRMLITTGPGWTTAASTSGTVTADSEVARGMIGEQLRPLARRARASLLGLYAELLLDFADGVIAPLRRALANSESELRSDAYGKVVQGWPERLSTTVPVRYRPTPNERVLLSPDGFDEEFHRLLATQFDAPDAGSAVDAAITRMVASGGASDGDYVGELLRTGKRWVPMVSDVRRPGAGERDGPLSVGIRLVPQELRRRAQLLTMEPEQPCGNYFRESIGDYFSDNVPDEFLSPRLRQLEGEFTEALKASAPLVSISATAAGKILGQQVEISRVFSGIPFPAGSKASKVAKRVLQNFGLTTDEVDTAFAEGSTTQFVDIFSTLAGPVEAALVDSLLRPIMSDWVQARGGGCDEVAAFWALRQARPPAQAVPMSPAVRRSMVRGWFTAKLLGQVRDKLDKRGCKGSLEIFVPAATPDRDGTYLAFATPLLLPATATADDRIAGVLMTTTIALLEANAGNLGPSYAYARLADLGSKSSTELAEWIDEGKVPGGAPTPKAAKVGSPDDSWQERRQAVVEELSRAREKYAALFDQRMNVDSRSTAWFLRWDYLGALEELIATAKSQALGSVGAESGSAENETDDADDL